MIDSGIEVLVVCKDIGDMNSVRPIANGLKRRGLRAQLIANGVSTTQLKEEIAKGDAFEAESAQQVLDRFGVPKLLLTGMSSKGGVGRDLIPLLRGQCPTVAFQDFWGAYVGTGWSDPQHRPDYVLVNDKLQADIIGEQWTGFDPGRVLATGFTALDQYASIDFEAEHRKACELLGVEAGTKLILFSGQAWGTGVAFEELVRALDAAQNAAGYCLIARSHPNMKANWPEEMEPWQRALDAFSGKGKLVVDSSRAPMPTLVAACAKRRGLVVSLYSTTIAIEAPAVRAPAISILYPTACADALKRSTNGILETLPPADLGCVASPRSRAELTEMLRLFFKGDFGLEEAQEQRFTVDGKNAERAADAIEVILEQAA